jgi:uridine kinase
MKKNSLILFTLLVYFFAPCIGWSQNLEDLHVVLENIQNSAKKKSHSPFIVAIGGCPGVGKSTIAHLLQDELNAIGMSSVIISLDHYGLSQNERKQFASELDPRRIQWDKIHETFTRICAGEKELSKPIINQLTKEMSQETLDLANIDCILFEGSYTLGDFPPMNFLQYADVAIYLESSLENIYAWKWQRELKKSSPRSPQVFFNHMIDILRDFAFHVYPTRKNADYLVQMDFSHHYRIDHGNKSGPEPDFTELRLETLAY